MVTARAGAQRISGQDGTRPDAGWLAVRPIVAELPADEAAVQGEAVDSGGRRRRGRRQVGVGQNFGAGGRVALGVVGGQHHVELAGRPPPQGGAQAVVIDRPIQAGLAFAGRRRGGHAARREHAAVVVDLDVAVLALVRARDPQGQLVGDRDVDRAAEFLAVGAAVAALDEAAEGVAGQLGDHLDGAADGVPAGKGALRPAQDLHPVEVQKVHVRAGQGGVVDVIHIDADPGLQRRVEVELADAADRSAERRPEGGAQRLQGHVRRRVGDVRHVGDAAGIQGGRIHRRDGQRRVLQLLGMELGGDDNLADRRRLGGRIRRRSRLGGERDGAHREI